MSIRDRIIKFFGGYTLQEYFKFTDSITKSSASLVDELNAIQKQVSKLDSYVNGLEKAIDSAKNMDVCVVTRTEKPIISLEVSKVLPQIEYNDLELEDYVRGDIAREVGMKMLEQNLITFAITPDDTYDNYTIHAKAKVVGP